MPIPSNAVPGQTRFKWGMFEYIYKGTDPGNDRFILGQFPGSDKIQKFKEDHVNFIKTFIQTPSRTSFKKGDQVHDKLIYINYIFDSEREITRREPDNCLVLTLDKNGKETGKIKNINCNDLMKGWLSEENIAKRLAENQEKFVKSSREYEAQRIAREEAIAREQLRKHQEETYQKEKRKRYLKQLERNILAAQSAMKSDNKNALQNILSGYFSRNNRNKFMTFDELYQEYWRKSNEDYMLGKLGKGGKRTTRKYKKARKTKKTRRI